MNLLMELFLALTKFMYHIIIAAVYLVLPKKRKGVDGDIVLITGAASGIGRLTALKFARLNATVVLWDVDRNANDAVAYEIELMGKRGYAYTVDITDRAAVYDAAERVRRDVGHVNILINNASVINGRKLLDCEDEMILQTMAVNMISHFWTVKAFLPAMIENDEGHIVTVATTAGLLGVNQLVDYCASKHGAVGFDESLRHELISMNCNINSTLVCPYFTTDSFDGCRSRFPRILPLLEPQYVADRLVDAVLFNEHIVVIPNTLLVFVFLKTILPTSAFIVLGKFFGTFEIMNSFKGHTRKSEQN